MVSTTLNANVVTRFRKFFTTRDFIFHDGRDLKRFSVAGRTQAILAGVAAVTVTFSAYGVSQAAFGAVVASGIAGEASTPEAKLAKMRAEVAQMEADVAAVKQAAQLHAARVEQRQKIIAGVLTGKGSPEDVGAPVPAAQVSESNAMAREVLAPLREVEARQAKLAEQARKTAQVRLHLTARHLRSLGIKPERYVAGGMGGPYEPVSAEAAAAAAGAATAEGSADAQFRSLFQTWQKLDVLEQTVIAIPSMQPVENVRLTSSFGVRSDPFHGSAAMHAGIDIPGPIGTPIYATADGVIGRAGRFGGYGNLITVNHGKGIETRYGHLSKILVAPNTRVRRGQLIGLMGSTGRSTGSHLHYEVRIDGAAVNPMPFMQNANVLDQIQQRAARVQLTAATGN
ncbi:M23 family peptidase [Sphingomonas koreensis]|jgi:murein DD-endopeptidase MepM/ murein hydrolase activator NlpD|uniref:M23 family peptidase n=1 Tax=Sphingomonas koreensis TaxID=93064 RepID=A0A1L6JE65_9SPHN|nr:M23 family metallopeptidase [Sphingomonas koreensis]APR54222.1 peptidase M23 [Sphingomonas koreensis]MDC7809228.1 M23 family metallopeptidase [Sphingomonas koreensis]PJI90173.1 murein DD-endopeptidase MepM/ murein hydrolase activator NlpD [Sphingomonas koreensis]RSU17309.1 M23 family peptidase [Sphingomonas koreensis]RSU21740.1 M23 family peptidase [Sphingomonas koreensis]